MPRRIPVRENLVQNGWHLFFLVIRNDNITITKHDISMEFLIATLIMAYTACLLGQNFLDLVVKISFEIYGRTYVTGSIAADGLSSSGSRGGPSIDLIRDALGWHLGVSVPDFQFPSPISWPLHMAPYVWDWIHVVAIHIDLNGGPVEKRNFLHLVERVILCAMCKEHFIHNTPRILQALEKTSLSNTFLALHTSISVDQHAPFEYQVQDVSKKYQQLYQFQYAQIRHRAREIKEIT